jgi:hypothetical protein
MGSDRDHGLTPHARAEFVSAFGEALTDRFNDLPVLAEGHSKQLRRDLPGNVIGGWAQSSGHKKHIAPGRTLDDGIADGRTIRHSGLTRNSETQRKQMGGDAGEVGIDHIAEQKLGPGVQQFNIQRFGHETRSIWSAWQLGKDLIEKNFSCACAGRGGFVEVSTYVV